MLKTDKISAFKKLLKIKKDGFDLYQTEAADMYGGGRIHEMRLLDGLENYKHENFDRRGALTDVLRNILLSDIPRDIQRIEEERYLIKLVLIAGADPNAYSRHYSGKRIFDSFMGVGRYYAAVEVAKSPVFSAPGDLEWVYESMAGCFEYYLKNGHHSPGKTTQEDEIRRYNLKDRKELVYILFKKGMYPYNDEQYKSLIPIVLEQDPNFFEHKKEKTIELLSKAKTPAQILQAIGENQKIKE